MRLTKPDGRDATVSGNTAESSQRTADLSLGRAPLLSKGRAVSSLPTLDGRAPLRAFVGAPRTVDGPGGFFCCGKIEELPIDWLVGNTRGQARVITGVNEPTTLVKESSQPIGGQVTGIRRPRVPS